MAINSSQKILFFGDLKVKDRLKQLRKELGIKQRELAERLGVDVSLIGKWETGQQSIPKSRLKHIYREFHVRPEWMENGEGAMFEPNSEEDAAIRSFIAIYDEMPENFKRVIRRAMYEAHITPLPPDFDGQDD